MYMLGIQKASASISASARIVDAYEEELKELYNQRDAAEREQKALYREQEMKEHEYNENVIVERNTEVETEAKTELNY